uniref:Putative Methyltransferase gidB (Glucose-inhibited division protein B) n=1 Tax=mine drainage metagenome TaxID=410659 RepID=E6PV62_9ZZZZ
MQRLPASRAKEHASAVHGQAKVISPTSRRQHPAENASASERLDRLLLALQLPATPTQRAQLLAYLELLERWNRVYNLTAVRAPQQMFTLHLADCLALVPSLAARAPRRLLDVGSGGGLPGLVLAIMLPEMPIVLNDAVQKKCAFMQQAAAELRLPQVQVAHGRVERLTQPSFDCITSRAFSDLGTLIQLTTPLLGEGGCWAAMKGHAPQAELAALPVEIDAHVEALTVPDLDAQRCVVWMLRRSNSTPPNPVQGQ